MSKYLEENSDYLISRVTPFGTLNLQKISICPTFHKNLIT